MTPPGREPLLEMIGYDRDVLARTWGRPPGFIGWLAQVNHKAVGTRYIVTGLIFFLLAGLDALRIRLQLAIPANTLLGPDAYDAAFTMHGTTMMFLFAVPILEGVGIYLVPLMIGARDMALPRLNAFGYWVYLFAGVGLWTAYLAGVPPTSGWFAYPPLTRSEFSPGPGMDVWATMITLLEVAALVAAVELIITVLKQRAPGMSLNRMPIFVWTMLVTAFMVIFAMPPLMIASLMLELDRSVGTHFFNPLAEGAPLLWQHLFWWFGHPDVYIVQLPAFGIVTSVVVATARRPVFGYTALVLATFAIGFLSFGLWVHHMYATGLPLLGMSFFAAASMMVAIPSGVQVFCWIATIWNGRVVVTTSFLFVVGAIITFVMGGVTGVMLASVPFDLQVHDTFFVVAHFHYVLFGSVVFPLFAGAYHWFPKVSGRLLGERLGRWNFGLMFAGTHLTFFPQHQLGFEGMPRRVFTYLPELGWGGLNLISSVGSAILAIGALLFLVNVYRALRDGAEAGPNPWAADSLEWSAASPPEPFNFAAVPVVRGRYPLWQHEPEGVPTRYVLRDDRRETPITSAVEADPQGKLVLPGPTLLPLWTALALFFTFGGLILEPAIVPVGLLVTGYLVVRWNWPRIDPEMEAAPGDGGTPADEHPPTRREPEDVSTPRRSAASAEDHP
jgi:cytochrome c oxidase subunit I+III